MKKRILSIMLTLCMVLSIAPTAAFAEGEGNTNTGKAISYEFIFCAFILLRLYLAGNIGLLFRKVQSHCAEMASDTKRPCRSEQRQLSVLIRQGHSDGPDEAEAVSTLSRSLAPTPLTVTPQIF